MTTDPRPRSFVWLETNGSLSAQIWFEEPRVGCEGRAVRAERRLDPSEYALTLDDLIAKISEAPGDHLMLLRVIDFETTGMPPDAALCEIGWCDVHTYAE